MIKITGIYVITNKVNGKQYVGLSNNCLRRWYDHRSKAFHSLKQEDIVKPLYKAFRKYGLENFTFEILEECEQDKLIEKEIYWVKKLNSYTTGYNCTIGGDLPSVNARLFGEEHGKALLTEEEVKSCRLLYKEGFESRKIWEERFSRRITYPGFQRMWHGKTWKHVMPEVFLINPRPKKRITEDHIEDILLRHANGQSIRSISKDYNGILGYGTVYRVCSTGK